MRKSEKVSCALKMSKNFCFVALKMIIHYNLCFKSETQGGEEMSDEISGKSRFSELTELAIKFYKENLKSLLEPEHIGEFVAIEPYSQRYFVHKNGTQALLKALAEMPDNKFYLARIGFKTTDRIGSYGSRNR